MIDLNGESGCREELIDRTCSRCLGMESPENMGTLLPVKSKLDNGVDLLLFSESSILSDSPCRMMVDMFLTGPDR